MKKLILIIALFTAAGRMTAQQTRTDVAGTIATADDTKLNSDAVPEVYAIGGQFERVLVLRFKHQADLLTGLEEMAKQNKIRSGVILSGIGSVRNYQYHVVSSRTFPPTNIFVKDPTAPADIVNVNGYIIDSRVHAHVTLTDADKAFGGHLEVGTNVFTFAIVTIGVLNDSTDLGRIDDRNYR